MIDTALQSCEAITAFTGKNYLPLVWHAYHSHRSLLFRMLDVLELASTSQNTRLLGVAACRQGIRVRFFSAAGRIADLMQAQSEQRFSRALAQLLTYQVLIVGRTRFSATVADGRTAAVSVLLNHPRTRGPDPDQHLRFADWTHLWGSENLTVALLDRVTARAHCRIHG